MRYDTLIVGGGLGGLVSGIALARNGQRVAIISAGRSALHFLSGSLEFYADGYEAIAKLAESHPDHPYNSVGSEHLERYLGATKEIFERAGVALVGDHRRNHLRLSPTGALRPAWLTMSEYVTFASRSEIEGRRVLVVALEGYLDFYPEFVAAGVERCGAACRVVSVGLDELARLRESATEMRAANISRVLVGPVLERLAHKVRELVEDEELVLLPAVFGLESSEPFERFRELLGRDVRVVATASASVPGVRMQRLLVEEFTRLGGDYILGDRVTDYRAEEGRIVALRTVKHRDEEFTADNFVLSTGSFFSHGLDSTPEGIFEPLFGLDISAAASREEWTARHILDTQPFQRFGVKVDGHLRPTIDGGEVRNLHVVGAVLAGADPVKEGCGAGVVVATALRAAEEILGHRVTRE